MSSGHTTVEQQKPRIRWDNDRRMWRVAMTKDHRGRPMMGRKWLRRCRDCSAQWWGGIGAVICVTCSLARHHFLSAVRQNASSLVQAAVRRGELPKLDGSVPCDDCGYPARVYDHRSYAKPLEVAPVCWSCNQRRGPAVEMAPHIIKWPRHMRAH